MSASTRPPRHRRPPARQDGMATRQQLLQAAGEVFAAHGYARATGKEICQRANANAAAVNYHFGGKDGLYAAVLEEAHRRLISIESLAAAAQSDTDARSKLRLFIGGIVNEIADRDESAWELRVLSRELLSQSSLMERMITNQVLPKVKIFSGIVAEIMQLPVTHPAVARSLVNIVGPCVFLLIANRLLQRRILPQLDLDAAGLTEHMVCFALAGMQTIAQQAKQSGSK